MKIKKLIDETIEYPVCGALLSRETREYWRGRSRPGNKGNDHCESFAKYKIGRKYFCKKHAGLYILDNFNEITQTTRQGE